MLTWQQWCQYQAHNKLFSLHTTAAASLGADGILTRCYSPIYAVLDHHLLTLLKHFPENLDHPGLRCTVGKGLLTSDVDSDGVMTNSIQPVFQYPSPTPQPLFPGLLSPPRFWTPYLILLSKDCCPHQSWDICPSLVLSFPHWETNIAANYTARQCSP